MVEGLKLRDVEELAKIPSVAASGEVTLGVINMGQMRNLIIMGEVTYNASATSGARVNLYYSHDGIEWTTVAYAYFDIDLTAGSTIREAATLDAPETGYLKVTIKNNDATYTVTNAKVSYSFKRWGDRYIQEADLREYMRGILAQKGGVSA